jgi:hypothetical protein
MAIERVAEKSEKRALHWVAVVTVLRPNVVLQNLNLPQLIGSAFDHDSHSEREVKRDIRDPDLQPCFFEPSSGGSERMEELVQARGKLEVDLLLVEGWNVE